MKNLPIGIQTFEKIINEDYCYYVLTYPNFEVRKSFNCFFI